MDIVAVEFNGLDGDIQDRCDFLRRPAAPMSALPIPCRWNAGRTAMGARPIPFSNRPSPSMTAGLKAGIHMGLDARPSPA